MERHCRDGRDVRALPPAGLDRLQNAERSAGEDENREPRFSVDIE